ncbi:hypothetical protein B9T23_13625 [Acinetobacter terrae]|uniref:hypothetical protein n=1 Tax=Acinetobacter terrae TaxID=2731247 RepID=UPI000B7040DF|nr:hypothetical protein [Acinetobacter terrae]OTG73389.1 hypothetical protein B9T23_13625 [Acinetobacter terrae]
MENPNKIEIEGLKTIHKLCNFGAEHDMEGCSFTEIVERMFDELAKAQAVPEGFVLVEIKDLRDVISNAGDAMMNEETSSVYDRTGEPSTWFDHYTVAEKRVLKAIEAQEQKG